MFVSGGVWRVCVLPALLYHTVAVFGGVTDQGPRLQPQLCCFTSSHRFAASLAVSLLWLRTLCALYTCRLSLLQHVS
jgi:hypothetical protein